MGLLLMKLALSRVFVGILPRLMIPDIDLQRMVYSTRPLSDLSRITFLERFLGSYEVTKMPIIWLV